jgi:hypothetical protein
MMTAYPGMTVAKFKRATVYTQREHDRVGAQLIELGVREE